MESFNAALARFRASIRPDAETAPAPDPTAPRITRDGTGRVFVTLPDNGRGQWPSDVPLVESKAFAPAVLVALGLKRTKLEWAPGTFAYVAGPRVQGQILARWLANKVYRQCPACRPVRVVRASSFPATWVGSRDVERSDADQLGAERTLVILDVLPSLGKLRLLRLIDLVTAAVGRSVILQGDVLPEATAGTSSDEWHALGALLAYHGARVVRA